tara:strand:+ start:321 stop:1832 length:1512 start_codon:yes stop_codon:yes gene_type:complete
MAKSNSSISLHSSEPKFEEADPKPELLIKSLAEQGYSLESALADLIDNSISADATGVEIMIDMDNEPFTLFLADDGSGMCEDILRKSMEFPSDSPDNDRDVRDLGRFGLGMKTASFSQTRSFTVISRKKGDVTYSGRTWDVAYLKEKKKWHLIVNSQEEVYKIVEDYTKISNEYLGIIEGFTANTIIVWRGLYKYEKYLEPANRVKALKQQLNEVTADHLSLVFHRFLERKKDPLRIRVNNKQIRPFDPFPPASAGVRKIESKRKSFSEDNVKLEGFVLPSSSMDEAKSGTSRWTTKKCSLTDMEGIYVYRADRVIIFGGWNGLIKKGPRLQLARLRVDVGNKVDHLLHLNVSKSQITIPHDLKAGFEHYVTELKIEAEREFYNRGIKRLPNDVSHPKEQLFARIASSKGTLLELNTEFPLLKSLKQDLTSEQNGNLNMLIRMINTMVNKIRQTHEDQDFTINVENISEAQLQATIQLLSKSGWTEQQIRKDFIPLLGYSEKS